MKKKTVNLLNSLKVIVETSYPKASKKMQKHILENFIYDSMINQLSQWAEAENAGSMFDQMKDGYNKYMK